MKISCIYCENSDFTDYLLLNEFEYKRCKTCSLVQLIPMPTIGELTNYYDSNYYTENYNADDSDRAALIEKYSEIQYKILERNFIINSKTIFLDFGCGTGSFLDTLAKHKHQLIYGLELSKASSEIVKSKGYGYVPKLEETSKKFDIITLWDVAEHLTDPIHTFKTIHYNLNENGIVVIGTARIDDFFDKTGFGYTMWADPPAHTILYNKKILIEILKKAGFNNISLDYKHTISNIYNSKYKMFKRLVKKILLFYRTDRKNKRETSGTYIVIVATK